MELRLLLIEGAAKDCPPPGGTETATEGPTIEWASSVHGPYDSIEGHRNPANPPSVLDGSLAFKVTLPEATVTVTGHLLHDGPIIVRHN